MTSANLTINHAHAITPSTWFVDLNIFKPKRHEDSSSPSKLEFLLLIPARQRLFHLWFKLSHIHKTR